MRQTRSGTAIWELASEIVAEHPGVNAGMIDIPPLSLERDLPKQIARFFEHHRYPDWPTDFD